MICEEVIFLKKLLLSCCLLSVLLVGCHKRPAAQTIKTGTLRATTFALVSSAENSTTDYTKQYAYIEDIGDGRGYTGGIIGFTSGTGDMLAVVQKYVALKPKHNPLQSYLSALKKVNGTASHQGLGPVFVRAWQRASKDEQFIRAQDDILNQQYMNVALKLAKKDHLGPLGQYIYYDALVVHGPGADAKSFQGMRQKAFTKAKTPAQGGNQARYLNAFLAVRIPVMKSEAAHQDLSRIRTQQQFLRAKNFNLALPLTWHMYGTEYHLTKREVSTLIKKTKQSRAN